jgi:hypothetical protein
LLIHSAAVRPLITKWTPYTFSTFTCPLHKGKKEERELI